MPLKCKTNSKTCATKLTQLDLTQPELKGPGHVRSEFHLDEASGSSQPNTRPNRPKFAPNWAHQKVQICCYRIWGMGDLSQAQV